ncbi:MAG: cation:proton antiporter [Campylobacterota bacterium]|nr:cation:proton antiporter [Campylobacterota bacterium]
MYDLYYLGVIFVLGAVTQWISLKLDIPLVVGYLLLGLTIGPEIFTIIPYEFVDNSHLITELSLSIIAVLVGATLKISTLAKHAKEVIYITLFQSFGTFLTVFSGFALLGHILDFPSHQILFIAFLLGAIATATAPATPLAIVHELKAKGKFTSTFLAVIALDDAVSLIIFTLALTLGISLLQNVAFQWLDIFDPFKIIVLSITLGSIAALINTRLDKLFSYNKSMETIATLGIIFIVYSLSEHWGLEPLLSAMTMGAVMVNISDEFDIIEEEIDNHLAQIIFMLFFIISAMHLQIDAIFDIPIVVIVYIILRAIGKVVGSYLGAIISKSDNVTRKYMGIALLPQAGVAIGLALSLQNHSGLQDVAPLILNIVIITTLVHELIGPFMTRYALEMSGETHIKKD